jgi:Transposase and inactivated derivatives
VPPAVPQGRKKRDQDSDASLQALGRCRGGFATKIHILCDGQGHPLTAVLSPAQDHESQYLPAVMDGVQLTGSESGEPIAPAKLAGDKGYRAQWIDQWLLGRNITPVIPSKTNEDRDCRVVEFDKASYRRRSIIEQMIGWLKECRRVATRYEKLARNYLSMVKLSMIGRYLRLIAPWDSAV